ncbi:MAG: hypothetical protein AAGA97_02565 [Pseudomonadota bacterium]
MKFQKMATIRDRMVDFDPHPLLGSSLGSEAVRQAPIELNVAWGFIVQVRIDRTVADR